MKNKDSKNNALHSVDKIGEHTDAFVNSIDHSIEKMTDEIDVSLDAASKELIEKNKGSKFIRIMGIKKT